MNKKNDTVHFFHFRLETPFLSKFGPNCQYLQFKVKLDTYNHFRNILRLFDVLTNFPFTTGETMRNYYL